MKTTDGFEIETGSLYFDEHGQPVVFLDGTDLADVPRYLVRYFYEGTAIDTQCYGDSPVEYNIPYECEGTPTIINAIFKVAPTHKLDEAYKARKNQLAQLVADIGEVSILVKQKNQELQELRKKAIINEKVYSGELLNVENLKSEKKALASRIDEARQKLSEYQDATGTEYPNELAELRKKAYMLQCIENAGVDDWEWIDSAVEEYQKRYLDD